MKIIVMSDSHGDKETVKAVSALPADAIFHCGDSELPFDDPILHKMHASVEIVIVMNDFHHRIVGRCARENRYSLSTAMNMM